MMRIFPEPPFRNEFLFSNHYLSHHLPRHPLWKTSVHREFELLRNLYAELQRLYPSRLNEAQLEELFIRPVLKEVLGWHVLPQDSIRIQGRWRLPASEEALFPERTFVRKFVQHAGVGTAWTGGCGWRSVPPVAPFRKNASAFRQR
jgi:hypothetical protein